MQVWKPCGLAHISLLKISQ